MATICMDGSYFLSTVIYQGVANNLQDFWLNNFKTKKVYFASFFTGWTNDSLGFFWLIKVFNRHTKSKIRLGRDFRLLLINGHGSHINIKFIEWCNQHKILLAVYPPYSTYRLQPLDINLFNPLANYYSQKLSI